ncbi:MAG: hypothetical protein EON88_03900 [Brevundimonas sp.]|nr:MAG: hypothetical protein EON88_03900 [Brevundimonas sp.]
MADDLYCKVYAIGPATNVAMREVLTTVAGGTFELRTLETGSLIIDLIETAGGDAADFANWPFQLEIDAQPGVGRDDFIAAIRALLDGLRARAVQAVPSCDFEDQLRRASCP